MISFCYLFVWLLAGQLPFSQEQLREELSRSAFLPYPDPHPPLVDLPVTPDNTTCMTPTGPSTPHTTPVGHSPVKKAMAHLRNRGPSSSSPEMEMDDKENIIMTPPQVRGWVLRKA